MRLAFDFVVAKAGDEVIVDHANRLHEGVADSGAHEGEPALLERFRHRSALRGFGGEALEASPIVDLRLPADELPQESREAAFCLAQPQEGARARYAAFNLGAIANDPSIRHQPGDFFG